MLKLKEKWRRIRQRQAPGDKPDGEGGKRRRFPKLNLSKLGFLSKFKRGHKPHTETNVRPPTPETPDASEGGIEDKTADVWCGDNGVQTVQEEDQDVKKDTVKKDTNDVTDNTNNLIEIKVECHENEEHVPFKRSPLKPDRMSKSSIGSGLLSVSRASMSSRSLLSMTNRSMSNMSVGSARSIVYKNMRTVWTQASFIPTHESATEACQKMTSGVSKEMSTLASQELVTGDSQDMTIDESQDMNAEERQEMISSQDLDLEVANTEQSVCSSIDFGIDDVLNEFEITEKLIEVKNKIVGRLAYPNLEHCEVSVCVDMLSIAKIPFLVALNKRILLDEGYFNEEFIVSCGIEVLLEELDLISDRGLENLADVTKSLLISECIASLFNSESGRKFVMENGEHISSVAKESNK